MISGLMMAEAHWVVGGILIGAGVLLAVLSAQLFGRVIRHEPYATRWKMIKEAWHGK
jgi:hypothetical protein